MSQGNYNIDIPNFIKDREIEEIKYVHKFGRNSAVGTGHTDIWCVGGLFPWSSTAYQLYAVSTNAQDGITGLGMRKIRVDGLNANCDPISEEITLLAGATSALTTNSFLRVDQIVGSAVGTYHGANYDDINLHRSNGVQIGEIVGDGNATPGDAEYGLGRSQLSFYAVPRGWTAYITHINVNVDTNASKTASMTCYQCNNIDDGSKTVRKAIWKADGITGSYDVDFESPFRIPEKSDIWMHAYASTTASVDVQYDLVLVKNR